MAFPTIRSSTSGTAGGTKSTTHTITLPTGHASGDLLLALVQTTTATPTISGWTQKGTVTFVATLMVTGLAIVDTGSLGSTVTLNLDASKGATWAVYCIQTGTWEGTLAGVEASTGATGTSATPDPDALNPTGWGTEDTLWLTTYASKADKTNHSAYPSSYTLSQETQDADNKESPVMGAAGRNVNAASEDPGTFTISVSESWAAMTWAVRTTGGGGGTVRHQLAMTGVGI